MGQQKAAVGRGAERDRMWSRWQESTLGLVGQERTQGQHSWHHPQMVRGQGPKLPSHPPLQQKGNSVCAPESENETCMFKLASSVFVIEL